MQSSFTELFMILKCYIQWWILSYIFRDSSFWWLKCFCSFKKLGCEDFRRKSGLSSVALLLCILGCKKMLYSESREGNALINQICPSVFNLEKLTSELQSRENKCMAMYKKLCRWPECNALSRRLLLKKWDDDSAILLRAEGKILAGHELHCVVVLISGC